MAVRRVSFLAASLALACGEANDPYSPSESGLSICAPGAVVEGIDVSKYEGAIDWTAVKNAGIGFGIARVSDGLNFPDAYFDSNWAGMKSAGLVRGAYQYFEPGQDATAQANMVLQHIGTLGAGDLPPFIDVETMGGQTAATVMAGVRTWLSVIENGTGRKPLVYASPSFWDSLGDATVSADLWIANWGVTCPSVPAAWTKWTFWQYTATCTVAGVNAPNAGDCNRFNGSMADLLAYAGGATAPPPPPSASITAPAAGATVSGTVTVTASANATSVKVELYVDAALLATAASASWDTTTAADGAHSLTAVAYDASGASTTSAAVSVTVSNSSGGGGGCSPFGIGAACPPPPPGCSTTSSGVAGLLALLVFAGLRRRSTRAA